MEWSKSPPAVEGYYWLIGSFSFGEIPRILEVIEWDGQLCVDLGAYGLTRVDQIAGTAKEWCGPLTAPPWPAGP